ncbi:uncharacterized protein SPAPADRAFT_60605 [Spathaspora passalidarum NRRL Y-27907]|uniref:Uncharacterized protein n=1 Tax=Spathaspora passalidarum (strain NRRL Y-27907 / 11-Y1) TaxID=619300 RepID=G3ALM5_SPAPN|nr:uncharacterized protein SPAPADRAFT_60605 [Spathaspora passalidarum NRRL Y-27907]EGW33269.1 hypothetical protein SPAPADRAFT_60605 [Spathaspora passalidarum NRRL Y-27907]
MATLSQIETVTNNNGQVQEIVRRNSINDMMNTLANLDLLNGNSFIKENKKEPVPEEHEIKTSSKTPLHCNTTPVIKEYWTDKDTSMDQDLLDEINQLPEDFEFEDHESKRPSSSPAFFRSNSYNKKPSKSVMSNQYQSNKIETTNKTVTFYRNSYSAPSLEIKKADSISRTPSARSYNSCTSVREEENSDEEDVYDGPKMRFYSQFMINDLHSNDSFSRQNNLKTISEGESPFLR